MSGGSPRLFGISKSNRDFSLKETWGKNQFNSSFPASLCCYLASKKVQAVYLHLDEEEIVPGTVQIRDVFGIDPSSDEIYFAFESQYTPYQKYVVGTLPRTDLVIQNVKTGHCLAGLEIKLTALPDNTTCNLADDQYGSEIVVRPDTIVYLACSIAANLGATINARVPNVGITDWSDPAGVLNKVDKIVAIIKQVSTAAIDNQKPFLLQPIWKTKGKSPQLAENCLDVFVWSDAGFARFIAEISNNNTGAISINRQTRTAIWLYKMLLDISQSNQFNHQKVIDQLSYNTKNDKAFATSGYVTNKFMKADRLENPCIGKNEIANIILGGGQNLLSPERRFDAIIFNSPELFEQ